MFKEISQNIFTMDDFLSKDICNDLIDKSEIKGYGLATIETSQGTKLISDIRNNSRVIIDDFDMANDFWNMVKPLIPFSMDFYFGRQIIGLNERFRFYRYEPHQEFKTHQDGPFRRENGEISQFTFMVYLNEEFDGGQTCFKNLDIEPKTGKGLIFKHDLFHGGKMVTSGTKYVMRTDVMYNKIGKIKIG